jgi:diguanylate cyclase (GGDEF)-like protein
MPLIDTLTKLQNVEELKYFLKHSNGSSLSILLLKIDGLNKINNAFGIDTGDEVIIKCADLLSIHIPVNGTLYRVGGGEFALLLNKPNDNQEAGLAKQIQSFFNFEFITLDEIEIKISISVGIASGVGLEVLKNATLALLEAKKVGRNKLSSYQQNSEAEARIKNNFAWQQKIKVALEDGGLVPYFQPIQNNATGKITKYEALIRLQTADGVAGPAQFLEAAKESGFLSQITRIVIGESFKVFSGSSYELSLNVTEDDLADDSFVDFLQQKFKFYNINPQLVSLEILEGIDTNMSGSCMGTIMKLKELGCMIVADDFGTEHSNFKRLLDLRIDIIKIDGSFIKNLDTDVTSQKIVAAIVMFANSISAKTVAEFVHNEQIQKIVEKYGIDYSQGYFIGEPIPFSNWSLKHT